MLEDIWKLYAEGEHQECLKASLDALVASNGIDLIHFAGMALMGLKRRDEGLALLKAATTVRPQSPHIHINAAFAAEQAGLLDEVTYFTTYGLMDFPDDIDLLMLKANNMVVQMQFDEAEVIYREILTRDPKHIQSLINIGNISRAKDDFAQAEQMFAQAAELQPDFRDLAFARATMFTQMGDDGRSIEILEQIAHDVDAQFLLALLYLSRGDYERGFRLHRARSHSIWFKTGNYVHPLNPFDHWTEATDKRIAVLMEAGLGDMLQFVRYIPKIAAITQSLTYYVPPTMMRLLRYNLPDTITLKTLYGSNMDYDYITTDVEMAYHFRTSIDTIPTDIPYLTVPPEVIEQHRLREVPWKRVGICWAGGERDQLNQRSYDERRSLDLKLLAPLAEVQGIEFVSLQYGSRANEAGLPMTRVIDNSFDFMDTAAIIAQLDLVITVDTSVVHLAGAMGKPTWLLSRYDCCWRWTKNAPDSVWYPGVVRVFGQKSYRDWSQPLQDIRQELEVWARGES